MTKENRPWGWYDVINEGARYKVKCIEVAAGSSLSLQRHTHRAEHWVVVEGTALVYIEGKKQLSGMPYIDSNMTEFNSNNVNAHIGTLEAFL